MPSLTTLVSFNSTNGAEPEGSLITDANGDLLGTTSAGGANDAGTVFEIANTASGYASSPTTLVSFNSLSSFTDGADPAGSLIADANGDLLGTTGNGGPNGGGTVFEIANTASGYASSPITLAAFNGSSGYGPNGSLITDANGDLLGTTEHGGASLGGAVFEIANTASGYASSPTALVSFNGTNGLQPDGSLIADANGDLFGTTEGGGAGGDGTVFEIANTASSPTTLVSFDGNDGDFPEGSLIADASGDLFGTTEGGGPSGDGTVFEIAKTANGYANSPTTLNSFSGYPDGYSPAGSLIADANGDLFGTTASGGAHNSGTVFEIANTATGYASSDIVLVSFNSTDGSGPLGSLIADATGDLFGTTSMGGASAEGGANGDGTVFEVTDSGFVVCYLAGTHILTPTGEVIIENLKPGDLVVTRFSGIQPIKWIGRQSYDSRFIRTNRAHIPVCIHAGALADHMPARDLYVSPGHSMLVNNQLVLARCLVNGITVTQVVSPAEIHYYQIELETHDCVIAEGAWSETFADGPGLRDQFHNATEFAELYPDRSPPSELSLCAPRPEHGPKLNAALRPVVARTAATLAPGPLRGCIDRIEAPWAIDGWAQDADHPELPVLLEVLLGDRVIATTLACDHRQDLQDAGIGQGRSAFFLTSPLRLRPEVLPTLRVLRVSDHAEIQMTPECRARIEAMQPTQAAPGLRRVA